MVAGWNKLAHYLRQDGNSQQPNTLIKKIKKTFKLGAACEIMDKLQRFGTSQTRASTISEKCKVECAFK